VAESEEDWFARFERDQAEKKRKASTMADRVEGSQTVHLRVGDRGGAIRNVIIHKSTKHGERPEDKPYQVSRFDEKMQPFGHRFVKDVRAGIHHVWDEHGPPEVVRHEDRLTRTPLLLQLTEAEETSGDLGDGYEIKRKPWEEFRDYHGPARHYWEITHPEHKKPIGKFLVASHPSDHPYAPLAGKTIMSQSYVAPAHRKKGLGTRAYVTLANHYGGLESDMSKTSRAASKLWSGLVKKHGAERLNSTNRGHQNKARFRLGPASTDSETALPGSGAKE